MAHPAYMEIADIPGSATRAGREDQIEVFAFEHQVDRPTDTNTGAPTGARVHREFKVLKAFDKSTPILYDYLCRGQVIDSVILHWYHTSPEGTEDEYFTHTLGNVSITKMEPHMKNVNVDQFRALPHQEWVTFRYENITWTFKDGNIEANDSWEA